jgi:hypothetical protein
MYYGAPEKGRKVLREQNIGKIFESDEIRQRTNSIPVIQAVTQARKEWIDNKNQVEQ